MKKVILLTILAFGLLLTGCAQKNVNVLNGDENKNITGGETNDNTIAPTTNQDKNVTGGEVNSDLTKDWLTYRNDKYGYEIKYPTLYNSVNESNQTKDVTIGSSATPSYKVSVKENISSLEELKSLMEEPIKEAMNQIKGVNSEITWKDTTVSGKKAIEMSYENFAGGYTGITHQTGVIKDTTAYIIIFINGSDTEYYQIISTFKFINR